MTPEEQAQSEKAAAAVLRHDTDCQFLRWAGQKLQAESDRRRSAGEPSLTQSDIGVLFAVPTV